MLRLDDSDMIEQFVLRFLWKCCDAFNQSFKPLVHAGNLAEATDICITAPSASARCGGCGGRVCCSFPGRAGGNFPKPPRRGGAAEIPPPPKNTTPTTDPPRAAPPST